MSSKAKERKLARKAETALANEHAATVKAANALADPFAPLAPALRSFALDGGNTSAPPIRIRLSHARAADLPATLLDTAHDLCRRNMQELYAPVWGEWDEGKKRRQLADASSRFILAYEEQDAAAPRPSAPKNPDSSSPEDQGAAADEQPPPLPVALVNYRFEQDDAGGTGRGGPLSAVPVAYCYEVQLEQAVQRRGLGKRLMKALEQLAVRAGMRAVVLTVLDANEAAKRLYASLGYTLDQNSPDPDDYEEAHSGYRILRKDFPEAVVKAAAMARAAAGAAGKAEAVSGGAGATASAAEVSK